MTKKVKPSKYSNHHSFWSDDFWEDKVESYSYNTPKEHDLLQRIKLVQAKRAVANFVTILTGKQIPVKFCQKGQSYTDGKAVTLSADIDSAKKFDVGVGLALHEASHIELSDFTVLEELVNFIPQDLYDKGKKILMQQHEVHMYVKDILNYIEDRRIDYYTYKTSPGYREYYLKLYDHYFGDSVINHALKSDEWVDETTTNYINRLINMNNPNSTLGALKGLREIWKIIDIKNIQRLTTTGKSLDVALAVTNIIFDNIAPPGQLNEGDPQTSNSNSTSDDDETQTTTGENDSSDSADFSDVQMEGNDEESTSNSASMSAKAPDGINESDKKTLSAAQQKKLEKVLNTQKAFLDGKVKKKLLSKQNLTEVNAMESTNATIESVGKGVEGMIDGVEILVIENLDKALLESGKLGLTRRAWLSDNSITTYLNDDEVLQAESLGNILAKKLQIRGEVRTTYYNRQRSGKIDKRMVSSLGFGNESVFEQQFIDKFKRVNLHLSIDASSSMGGVKWKNTLMTTITLAKAVSLIPNIDMQVSIRYSIESGRSSAAAAVMAWDSRKESFQKVKSMFRYLHANGTTPEGLIFEALQKRMVKPSEEIDSYFINICDGQPYFEGSLRGSQNTYSGSPAKEHTKKEVRKFKEAGIKTLGYFVEDGYGDVYFNTFKEMYGQKESFLLKPNEVHHLANTMNKLLLTKDNS